jgi:hypothetical protein
MLMFIDMETSGLIQKTIPLDDPAQPWAIKIAVDHTDDTGKSWNRLDVLIKSGGRKVQEGALAVHGFTPQDADRHGVSEGAVLNLLAELAGDARRCVSYGSFDRMMVESLMLRLEIRYGKPKGTYVNRWIRRGLEFVDLMVPHCQQAVKKPSKHDWAEDYAWPSLDDSIAAVLGETPDRATHDAWDDLTFAKRIYFALRDRGHFDTEAA